MSTTTTTNGARVKVTSEPMTYRSAEPHSYFGDLILAAHPDKERGNRARERLIRHERELTVETRATTVTYADPPLWLIDRFATYPRPDRVLLNLIDAAGNLIELPQKPGVSSISTLRLTTGTATNPEGPGTPGAEQDVVDAAVPTGATTDRDPTTATRIALIAGNATVPLPMVEQSGPGLAHMDQVLWKDLTSDYDSKVELQLLTGTGGSGPFAQLLGLLNVTGVNSVTYTDATPTGTKFIQVQSTLVGGGAAPQAIAAIGNKRKRKPEAWMMTSSRAAWVAASEVALPLALANQRGPGEFDLLAYPTWENDSIPTNLGAAGNQDVVVCFRPSDLLVWESAPTMSVFTDVASGTLEARVQLRRHVGAVLGRYPTGVSVVSGTGMAVQTALGF